MKRLDAGSEGDLGRGDLKCAASCDCAAYPDSGDGWSLLAAAVSQDRRLRPVQHLAIIERKVLRSRKHLVISAPTNSGKSLIGHLLLLEAVGNGRRGVLVEPLRALAQEQALELRETLAACATRIGVRAPLIRLSTGDYRLEGEDLAGPPPDRGEIIVATPERFDAILRNPSNAAWTTTIGAVVVDEAQLLGDSRRGPLLELLIATMLSLPAPPRIALLSATIGEPDRLREWLRPCELIVSSARSALKKEVWEIEPYEDADEALGSDLEHVLAYPENAAVVFVYQRRAAESLARRLTEKLGVSVRAYHSGMSVGQRASVRSEFENGRCRCVVATTSLAMGVNLPATHVFLRDTTFYGFGKLGIGEIVQILGRAGRGDRSGTGAVVVRPTDDWNGMELSELLRVGAIPPIRSSFELQNHRTPGSRGTRDDSEVRAANLVAVCLGRSGEEGASREQLESLLGNTLGARALVAQLDAALRWLSDPFRSLAYCDEFGRFHLTVLARSGVQAVLPLAYTSGLGQLLRDLLSTDPDLKLLRRWSALDHLFLTSLLSDRAPRIVKFSETLANKIDAWIEARPHDEKSVLFAEWAMGSNKSSRADELLGSLGVATVSKTSDRARSLCYVAILSAIVLADRGRGVPLSDIERRWGLEDLEGQDETWRDTVMWLLSGHAAILDLRCFYHHLLAECRADHERIQKAKRLIGRMRAQTFELRDYLKYCSPLGPLMRGIRESSRDHTHPMLGVGTIRKLEESGITSLQQVAKMNVDGLVGAGVQRRFAQQISAYIKRRQR